MLIREYTDADLAALERMHAAQGFGYPFPDVADPIFLSKLVVEDGAGQPVMASLVRMTAEVYQPPRRRWAGSGCSRSTPPPSALRAPAGWPMRTRFCRRRSSEPSPGAWFALAG